MDHPTYHTSLVFYSCVACMQVLNNDWVDSLMTASLTAYLAKHKESSLAVPVTRGNNLALATLVVMPGRLQLKTSADHRLILLPHVILVSATRCNAGGAVSAVIVVRPVYM